MESFMEMPQRVTCCPMFCIMKSVLFGVVVLFMLFLPLGDPNIACHSDESAHNTNTRKAMCYLCEGYFLVAKATEKAKHILQYVACVIANMLYEGKLKFYEFLERMDKRDLCNSVCCAVDDDVNYEEGKESRCPRCKCVRKKCHRRPRTECGVYAQL